MYLLVPTFSKTHEFFHCILSIFTADKQDEIIEFLKNGVKM